MEIVMWTVTLVHLLCKSPFMLCLHEIMYLYHLNYLKCLQCFKFKFTIYQQLHQFYHSTLHLSFNSSLELYHAFHWFHYIHYLSHTFICFMWMWNNGFILYLNLFRKTYKYGILHTSAYDFNIFKLLMWTSSQSHGSLCHFQKDIVIYEPFAPCHSAQGSNSSNDVDPCALPHIMQISIYYANQHLLFNFAYIVKLCINISFATNWRKFYTKSPQ